MSTKKAKPRGKPFTGKNDPRRCPHRPKGAKNKFSRDIREAIINALERLGGDDYLVTLGQKEKRAFAALLGKAMPLQVAGEGGGPIRTAVALSVSFKEGEKKE